MAMYTDPVWKIQLNVTYSLYSGCNDRPCLVYTTAGNEHLALQYALAWAVRARHSVKIMNSAHVQGNVYALGPAARQAATEQEVTT